MKKTPTSVPISSSQSDYSPINKPVATTGCGLASPIPAGTSTNVTIPSLPTVSEGQHTRTYRVHIPKAYDTFTPLAVVLIFHGHGGNAAGMESYTAFSQLADQQHFIAVYPQGLPDGENGQVSVLLIMESMMYFLLAMCSMICNISYALTSIVSMRQDSQMVEV